MTRRLLLSATILVLLAGSVLQAQEEGQKELALGKEAAARLDHFEAVERFARATGALDAQRDREALADAYYHLGLTYLTGLEQTERALAAFLKSAELAADPTNAWVWAARAAGKLGRTEDAAQYMAKALPGSPASAFAPAPAVAEPAAPQPAPVPAPEAPREEAKGDSFQHLFGAGKTAPPAEKTPEAAPQPAAVAEEKKVTAFDHLFGKKKKPAGEESPKPPR